MSGAVRVKRLIHCILLFDLIVDHSIKLFSVKNILDFFLHENKCCRYLLVSYKCEAFSGDHNICL